MWEVYLPLFRGTRVPHMPPRPAGSRLQGQLQDFFPHEMLWLAGVGVGHWTGHHLKSHRQLEGVAAFPHPNRLLILSGVFIFVSATSEKDYILVVFCIFPLPASFSA